MDYLSGLSAIIGEQLNGWTFQVKTVLLLLDARNKTFPAFKYIPRIPLSRSSIGIKYSSLSGEPFLHLPKKPAYPPVYPNVWNLQWINKWRDQFDKVIHII